MVSNGMPALWLTLNPSDLRSPLVLSLAGVKLDPALLDTTAIKNLQESTATMNSVAIAQSFDVICKEIFEYLLAAGSKTGGIFGPVSTYFGTVETNGRGMLHLHLLVWLRGAYYILFLQQKLQTSPDYVESMITFIDSIIRCLIYDAITGQSCDWKRLETNSRLSSVLNQSAQPV